jgi:hypothetical protein
MVERHHSRPRHVAAIGRPSSGRASGDWLRIFALEQAMGMGQTRLSSEVPIERSRALERQPEQRVNQLVMRVKLMLMFEDHRLDG